MKVDVKVKNLGRLKEAEFQIRPMTVITGQNGTGKSFFTKSLYSIFNVINKNVYHESVNQTIRQIQLQLETFISNVAYVATNDFNVITEISNNLDKFQKVQFSLFTFSTVYICGNSKSLKHRCQNFSTMLPLYLF